MKKNIIDILLTVVAILIIGLVTGKWLLAIIFCLVIYFANNLAKRRN